MFLEDYVSCKVNVKYLKKSKIDGVYYPSSESSSPSSERLSSYDLNGLSLVG